MKVVHNFFRRGFCSTCVNQLQFCPMCRAEVKTKFQEVLDSPTGIEEDITNPSTITSSTHNKA